MGDENEGRKAEKATNSIMKMVLISSFHKESFNFCELGDAMRWNEKDVVKENFDTKSVIQRNINVF